MAKRKQLRQRSVTMPELRLFSREKGLSESDIEEFETTVMSDLEDLRGAAQTARETENFTKRLDLNERRSRAKVEPEFLRETGQVAPAGKDGHAKMNITQGASARNIFAMGSILNEMMFVSDKDFFIVRGRGRKTENKKLEQILTHLCRYFLRKGNFLSKQAAELVIKAPTYGICQLRFDFTQKTRLVRTRTGQWQEIVAGDELIELELAQRGEGVQPKRVRRWKTLIPQFRIYPIQDVFVGDVNLADDASQRHVWWMNANQTVDALADEEVTIELAGVFEEDGTPVRQGVQRLGKWINFDALRKKDRENRGGPGTSTSDSSSDNDRQRASATTTFTLVSYEGSLPWVRWIEDKDFTFKHARHYARVSNWGDIFTGLTDSEKGRHEMARRLSKIPVWNVTYTGGMDPGSETPELGRVLLQIEPSRFHEPRHTLWDMRCYPDRNKYYPQSIPERVENMERYLDLVRNAQAWTADYNADPGGVYDESVLEDPKAIDQLSLKGTWLAGKRGADARNALMPRHLEEDPRSEEKMASVEQQIDLTLALPAVVKGQGSAGTATQEQLNKSSSLSNIRMIAVPMNFNLCRMVKFMICEAFHFLGKDEFRRMAVEVAALDAAEIKTKVLDDIEEGEFDILPVLISGEDGIAQATVLQRGMQVGPDFQDMRNTLRKSYELAGVDEVEKLVPTQEDLREPEEEHDLMKTSTFIKVQPEDNHEVHVAEHMGYLNAVLTGEIQLDPIEEIRIHESMPKHIRSHQTFMEQQALAAQQQAAQQQADPARAGAEMGGAAVPAGLSPTGLETDTRPAGQARLSQIHRTEGGTVV